MCSAVPDEADPSLKWLLDLHHVVICRIIHQNFDQIRNLNQIQISVCVANADVGCELASVFSVVDLFQR